MSERERGRTDSDVDAHVQGTVERWPQVDPEVERIVVSLGRADRLVQKAATVSLARVGLSYEEFKVLIALHRGARSHGSLCRELLVSTGAMTNRLDKLERAGLLKRHPDPADRRGVLLEITDAGRERLDAYIDLQARREIDLLSVLATDEKHELNRLLGKLVEALQSELGPAPKRSPVATEDTGAAADSG
jgi:DNA-binding MarR family transcriptional regulator